MIKKHKIKQRGDMFNLKKVILLLVITFLISYFGVKSTIASELSILSEEDPPYSFTDKMGNPDGFGVEIVTEIQKRINGLEKVKIIPWARAYDTILKNPNIVVFTMSRTKERENLFQWIGPIVENDWVFVAKKESTLQINSLEDAKKLKRIGTVREYAWTKFLEGQGFTNLDQITERKQNVLKLNLDRIEAFISADSSYQSEIKENGFNPDEYKIIYRFNTIQMYIAHSKDTDKSVIEKWQKTLDEMKADGTFQKIHTKWLPDNKLPGPGRPGAI